MLEKRCCSGSSWYNTVTIAISSILGILQDCLSMNGQSSFHADIAYTGGHTDVLSDLRSNQGIQNAIAQLRRLSPRSRGLQRLHEADATAGTVQERVRFGVATSQSSTLGIETQHCIRVLHQGQLEPMQITWAADVIGQKRKASSPNWLFSRPPRR